VKFGIDKIRLWSKHGEVRDVDFERGRINVLTGGSSRGKTSLLHIIDYCLLSSEHKLPHDVINDNVAWYGLQFYINDKTMVIARKSPTAQNVSDQFYFSSIGTVPEVPEANAKSDDIKAILQAEFGLDSSVVLWGGRGLKQGTQMSFRYFMLMNTISENTITNSEVYFDNQQKDRYRVALPQVLDLSLGIDTLDNIGARERKKDIQRQIDNLEKKKEKLSSGKSLFEGEARKIAATAAEYGLIEKVPKVVDIAFLKGIVDNCPSPEASGQDAKRFADAKAKMFELNRKMRKLREFTDEHKQYKSTLKVTLDSLKPLETLLGQADQLIKTEIFDDLINGLNADLRALKLATATKQPVDTQVANMLRDLEAEKKEHQKFIDSLPQKPKSFETAIDHARFIGRIEAKLESYHEVSSDDRESYSGQIAELQEAADEIHVHDVVEVRQNVNRQIDDIAQALLVEADFVMDNYVTWHPAFSFKHNILQLRKPQSSLIENVGSSSNHMFMHLILFLALHEASAANKSRFVPNFLFIDQPSRPYYGEEKVKDETHLKSSDAARVSQAFVMLDNFITRMKSKHDTEFQMIILEHVPVDVFKHLKNVHVLPEFREANALIPEKWKNRSRS
jgi:hypothetical protein